MLHELLQKMPLEAGPLPAGADPDRAEYFWPEGFACTVFCVNVRAAVLAQEFDATTDIAPEFFDIRGWWSFRENVGEEAASAIGFFDLFVGAEPDWAMPTIFREKLRRSLAPPDARPSLTDIGAGYSAALNASGRLPNQVLRIASRTSAPTPGECRRPRTLTRFTWRQNSGSTTGSPTTPG